MNREGITVTIPLNDYESLIRCHEKYCLLKDTLFGSTRLNYKGDDLYISDANVLPVLRLIDEMRYMRTLRDLQERKAHEDTESGNS